MSKTYLIVMLVILFSNQIGVATGVICAKPITLWGMRFVADYKYHEGYKQGSSDYMGTEYAANRANIRCDSEGEVSFYNLSMYQVTMFLDEKNTHALKTIFLCPDNYDRSK